MFRFQTVVWHIMLISLLIFTICYDIVVGHMLWSVSCPCYRCAFILNLLRSLNSCYDIPLLVLQYNSRTSFMFWLCYLWMMFSGNATIEVAFKKYHIWLAVLDVYPQTDFHRVIRNQLRCIFSLVVFFPFWLDLVKDSISTQVMILKYSVCLFVHVLLSFLE